MSQESLESVEVVTEEVKPLEVNISEEEARDIEAKLLRQLANMKRTLKGLSKNHLVRLLAHNMAMNQQLQEMNLVLRQQLKKATEAQKEEKNA